MKRTLSALLVVLWAFSASADGTTNPIRYTWVATSCTSWNCAASALVLANGDKYVIALPTGVEEHPWLILRRVEEGAVYIPEDEPFGCKVFEDVRTASTHFEGTDSCHAPIILNVPDGRTVLLSLHNCNTAKRRAVR